MRQRGYRYSNIELHSLYRRKRRGDEELLGKTIKLKRLKLKMSKPPDKSITLTVPHQRKRPREGE